MTMPLLVVVCLTSVTVIIHAFGTLEHSPISPVRG
jgi:hypothetical protein